MHIYQLVNNFDRRSKDTNYCSSFQEKEIFPSRYLHCLYNLNKIFRYVVAGIVSRIEKWRELMTDEKKSNQKGAMTEWNIPRRGFLQRASLVTGAFIAGVFRLDEVLGSNAIQHCYDGDIHDVKCCSLCCESRQDCPPAGQRCVSELVWLCSDRTQVPNVMYRCVECYSIDVHSTPNPACSNRSLCQYVICSRAQGPNE